MTFGKKQLLIIDDDDSVRESARVFLEQEGYKVHAAYDGISGKKILKKEKCLDLILLDIRMPDGYEGLQILEEIRKDNADIPVIMFTILGEPQTITKSFHLGATDYLVKPYKEDDLINIIEKVIGDPRILIIDDEESLRESLSLFFTQHDLKSISVPDGEHALLELKEWKGKINLIILDLKIPDTDTDKLFDELHEKYPEIPIIILTVMGNKNEIIKFSKKGASSYIIKPYKEEELLQEIQRVIIPDVEKSIKIKRYFRLEDLIMLWLWQNKKIIDEYVEKKTWVALKNVSGRKWKYFSLSGIAKNIGSKPQNINRILNNLCSQEQPKIKLFGTKKYFRLTVEGCDDVETCLLNTMVNLKEGLSYPLKRIVKLLHDPYPELNPYEKKLSYVKIARAVDEDAILRIEVLISILIEG